MSGHTPGPWMVSFDATRYAIHQCEEINGVQHRRTPIAFVPKFTKVGTCEVEEHRMILQDARLIAAAPELLEALERIGKFKLSQFLGPHDMALECVNIACAAIAKATGGKRV
jgi:hypothetical protein